MWLIFEIFASESVRDCDDEGCCWEGGEEGGSLHVTFGGLVVSRWWGNMEEKH